MEGEIRGARTSFDAEGTKHKSGLVLSHAEAEASMRAPLITEVIFWASRGSLERMQQIIDEHQLNVADESFADYDRRTPLALAAAEGSFRVCAWLLDKGAPVNMVDRFFYTPLTGAVQGNHTEVINLLLKHGGMVYEDDKLVPLMDSVVAQNRGLTNYSPIMGDENWEIPESEVSLLQPHGAGAFGTVYQARWRGTVVAAKNLKVDVQTDAGAMAEFKTELGLMQRLHHPNIVQFLGACTKTKRPILVTEFMYGASLDRVFRDRGQLPLEEAMQYSLDISKGLAYLHGKTPNPVIHRDLKPANVMLSLPRDGVAKIGDFGLSRTLAPVRRRHPWDKGGHSLEEKYVMTGETGSYRYMSPEVFRHESYNSKADCYAFAMIAYQLFEGRQPFEGQDPVKAAAAAASNGLRPNFTNKRVPPKVIEIIKELWDPMPHVRPNFMEVLVRLEAVDRSKAFQNACAKRSGRLNQSNKEGEDSGGSDDDKPSCACVIA